MEAISWQKKDTCTVEPRDSDETNLLDMFFLKKS